MHHNTNAQRKYTEEEVMAAQQYVGDILQLENTPAWGRFRQLVDRRCADLQTTVLDSDTISAEEREALRIKRKTLVVLLSDLDAEMQKSLHILHVTGHLPVELQNRYTPNRQESTPFDTESIDPFSAPIPLNHKNH